MFGLTGDLAYCYPAGPAAYLWAGMGWRPHIIAIRDDRPGSWDLLSMTLALVQEICPALAVSVVECPDWVTPGSAAKLARYLPLQCGIPGGAYCMTTDADMWPVGREFFSWAPVPGVTALTRGGGPHVEACYVAATAPRWDEVLAVEAGTATDAVHELFDRAPEENDEAILADALRRADALVIERRAPGGRAILGQPLPPVMTDAHVGREAYQRNHHRDLVRILRASGVDGAVDALEHWEGKI